MNRQEFLDQYLVDRRQTDSSKWDGMKEKFGEEDLLPMWIADMEFKTCDAITAALTERCKHGVFGYSMVPESYYKAYSDWMDQRYSFPLKKDWVRFSTGCVTGIAWMIHAYTQPGDACMILTPVYYPFHNVVTNNNRRLVTVDLHYEHGYFTMDYEAIEKAIIENDVKMFVQCSPHNPAGRVWDEEELDQVLAICEKHHVLVVSDEIHQDLVIADKKFIPAAAVSNGRYRDIIVTLSSASKTFNLATLLHSHIIITNDELRARYDQFASGLNRTEVSIMGMLATQAGYEAGSEWLSHVLDTIRDNYIYLKEILNQELPEVTVCELEGTYLAFLDMRGYLSPDEVQHFIQKQCHLAVDYGEWFGANFKGFIRLNLATDPKFVRQAAEIIIEMIKNKKNS